MSGKNLTFKLVMDADVKNYVSNIKQSESVTKSVLTTIKAESDRLKNASSGAAEGLNALSSEARSTAQHVSALDQAIDKTNTELAQTDTAAQTAQKGIAGLRTGYTALIGVMGGIGIGLGLRELAEAADSYTNLSARINIATKDGGDFTSAMAGVHQVALATNSSLDATGSLFTRLNAVGKEMGMTQQNTLDLTKTINQAIQTSGGTAEASEAAITQLIQAMQGGVLRGEEFNSIMENGYGVAEALAKGLGVTTGELRKMAENGELGAERVYKALLSQKDAVQQTFDQFPTTIGNALTKISTQWQILIGTMDQANGASATVADWLVTIADNMNVVEVLLQDIGNGFIWAGDQLKRIDPQTIEALKQALSTAYESLKDLGSTMGDSFERSVDLINTALGSIFDFNNGISTAESNTNGITKALQALNAIIGFVGDGFAAINIVANLLTGVFYDLSSAWEGFKARFKWGDAKDEAIAEMEAMAQKAQDYYDKASNGAMDFKSKGIAAIQAIRATEEEKNAESVASSKAKLDQLLADQQAEVNSKKANESEKLSAVQAYAEAAIKANGGVMDGVMQADLLTKGYIVTIDQAGKTSVEAWKKAEDGADKSTASADKARKAAAALGLDLDVSLNRVSSKFKESEIQLNNFTQGLEKLGIEGKQAGDVTYEAWLKWLETAKSQAEIDFAKAKLKEFGDQGQISTSQVEQGLIAIKLQAQELPDDIDPVTEAFKRLGIQTKEQLKLSAQQALMDYITIRDSGKATAEGIQKAYEKAAQSAAASGDAGVIAATNAANAGRNLEIQIDETGKAAVKSNDEWDKSNHRVRDSARDIGDGYRNAGQVAREEAQSASDAWQAAVAKSNKEFRDEMKAQGEALSSMYDYQSYSKADVLSQLKSKGYSDKEAQKLAGDIWAQGMAADRDAKYSSLGRSGPLTALINAEFDKAASKGLTTQNGTNKINELLRQMSSNSLVSTGPSTKSVDVNSLAPNVNLSAPSAVNNINSGPTAIIRFESNGQQVEAQVDANQVDPLVAMLEKLKVIKKSS